MACSRKKQNVLIMETRMIFDAHLDLSMNAMEWNRDLRLEIAEIRERELGHTDKPDRGNNVVCFPEMRKGHIPLCVGTLIARYVKPSNPLPGWHSPEQAWAQTCAQLAWYRAVEKGGQLKQIKNKTELVSHLNDYVKGEGPIGYLLSLEGADSLVNMEYLEQMHKEGLIAIGPAHYGPGTYAQGTNAEGGIGEKGKILLKKMFELGIIMDATHLCDDSFWDAMANFDGVVWASHSLCRSIVNHNRQFSDEQLKLLIERDAVIGMALDAWMMIPNWDKSKSTPENMGLNLEHLADHIDYICQLAGSSKNIMLGTDLDGGFGKEQMPREINTIADMQKLPAILKARNYTEEDIEGICWKNGIDFLKRNLN